MGKAEKTSEAPIPKEWRDAVVHVFRTRNKSAIIVTDRTQHEWDMAFPSAYPWDLYTALEAALGRDGLTGCLVPDIRPPGEAYAFLFEYDGKKLYGKVNLLPNRMAVIIVSAHIRYKGDTL